MPATVEVECAMCHDKFVIFACRLKRPGYGKFCSRKCKCTFPRTSPVFDAKECIVRAFELGYRATDEGIIMSPTGEPTNMSGEEGSYLTFSARTCRKPIAVHRFVAYQKFGNKMLSAECVRHLNDQKRDNRFENIEIGTRHDNLMDIPAEKRRLMGIRRNKNRRSLTDDQVREFRIMVADGWSVDRLSRVFNISVGAVMNLKHGVTYTNVSADQPAGDLPAPCDVDTKQQA